MARLLALGALGAALSLAAGLFDAEALWVPGAGLLLLALILAASLELAARGARVQRRLSRARLSEGEPLEVEIVARAGRLGLAGGDVDATAGRGRAVALRAGSGTTRVRRTLTWERRGRHALAPPAVALRDPLGLGRRVVRGTEEDSVLVLPRLEPVTSLGGGLGLSFGHQVTRPVAGAESEQDGLRPYRPGAPANRIHWPALARGAGLVERRLLPDADRLPLVALDPSGGTEADLDAAVRAAASLAWSLAHAGGCAVLLPGDRRPTPIDDGLTAWPAVHARLALVTAGPPLALPAHLGNHRTLLYVAPAPRRLPAAVLAGGTRVLVVPVEQAGAPVLEVAGCRGYLVGARAEARAA
jgi:uncharacterized protein (DUF58 family)